MYRISKAVKTDPQGRWALPDRAFFACGACHILAHAFIARYASHGFTARWLKPAPGYIGNHIIAVSGEHAFDYHGHSRWDCLLDRTKRKAQRWWPGWTCEVVELPTDVLISERASQTYDGLWLREPKQFLHDAAPRAERFVDRFSAPVRT